MRVCLSCEAALDGETWACERCGWSAPVADGIPLLAPEQVDAGHGFDPTIFEHLVAIEDASFWFRSRSELILWALDRYFPGAGSMLEIGVGTGYVLRDVLRTHPQMRLAGAELFPDGLRHARPRLPGVELLQLDATRMPYRDEWDVAGAFDVIEHIADDAAVLRGLAQAVVPGGGVLITVPQHPSLWSAMDDHAKHERRYRRRELVARIEEAGLRVELVTSFVSVLLPAMYASRVVERVRRAEYDPSREHDAAAKVPGLGAALAFERALIRRGVRLPAGGSLLAVARRA